MYGLDRPGSVEIVPPVSYEDLAGLTGMAGVGEPLHHGVAGAGRDRDDPLYFRAATDSRLDPRAPAGRFSEFSPNLASYRISYGVQARRAVTLPFSYPSLHSGD